MSQATARQVRRATRKLLGNEGRQLVEAQAVILAEHATALVRLQRALEQAQSQAFHAQQDVQALTIRLEQQRVLAYDIQTDTWRSPLRADVQALQAKPATLWQRLRWLLTGQWMGQVI